MQEKISTYLSEMEKTYQIEILLACETGSRAWGFPSTDSDYDVRIIYRHPRDWYLRLFEGKDTIELFFEDNEIDISGWDLRKALRLLWKSNPSLLERMQSPIVYRAREDFVEGLTAVAQGAYSRIATLHHYLSMGKKTFEGVQATEAYKLKKFFYALRTSVACRWVLEREEMPPIVFGEMLAGLDLPDDLTRRIGELIALKATVGEGYLHTGEPALFELMRACIARADEEGKRLLPARPDAATFDDFFIKHVA